MTLALYDPQAEEGVAACAAHSRTAALACTDRLRREHFHDPRCWAVVEAGIEVPNERPEGVADGLGWWREWMVADRANVPRPVVERWCSKAPAAFDASARLADRVVAAAARRAEVAELLERLEGYGVAVEWEVAA